MGAAQISMIILFVAIIVYRFTTALYESDDDEEIIKFGLCLGKIIIESIILWAGGFWG